MGADYGEPEAVQEDLVPPVRALCAAVLDDKGEVVAVLQAAWCGGQPASQADAVGVQVSAKKWMRVHSPRVSRVEGVTMCDVGPCLDAVGHAALGTLWMTEYCAGDIHCAATAVAACCVPHSPQGGQRNARRCEGRGGRLQPQGTSSSPSSSCVRHLNPAD